MKLSGRCQSAQTKDGANHMAEYLRKLLAAATFENLGGPNGCSRASAENLDGLSKCNRVPTEDPGKPDDCIRASAERKRPPLLRS
jgi:hypothetical protein